jgi:F420-0:gamma-glutamyl ligase
MSDMNLTAQWVKSSFSQQGGNCIEVAVGVSGVTPVRDSKDPEGPVLVFPAEAWQAFVAATAADEFGGI